MVGGETLRRGEYDTVVKSLSEVKKLKPIEQLEFLSSVVEAADAMRQMFLFAKKYIRKATDQDKLDKS